jgi:hypothetical protein
MSGSHKLFIAVLLYLLVLGIMAAEFILIKPGTALESPLWWSFVIVVFTISCLWMRKVGTLSLGNFLHAAFCCILLWPASALYLVKAWRFSGVQAAEDEV